MFKLLISADELILQLASAQPLVFDVRHDLADHQAGRQAYQAGHVPGALYLDHEEQLSGTRTGSNGRHPLPDRDDFAALMCSQGLTQQRQVVVYDGGNSMFAAHLWWMLRWLGHERVAVLDGGWPAWVAAGGQVETGINTASVTEAQALQGISASSKAAMPLVDTQAVLANLAAASFTVLDARAANRYRGEVEPMDPVAGHIPGALNRPNTLNLQDDGRFRPAEELRQEFLALLPAQGPQAVVHQCGSGITACHNLFAMELAGLTGSALYPGSWSEWCSDASRPMVRAAD